MDILDKVYKLEKDAENFGFSWENPGQILQQIASECQEVQEHLAEGGDFKQNSELQEEIGDIMHAAFSLCVFCDYDIRETINISVEKFDQRMLMVRKIAAEHGVANLTGCTFAELMQYWDEAKTRLAVKSE